jgi:hypothetical protein
VVGSDGCDDDGEDGGGQAIGYVGDTDGSGDDDDDRCKPKLCCRRSYLMSTALARD